MPRVTFPVPSYRASELRAILVSVADQQDPCETLDMDFEAALAGLLKMIGRPVGVMISDADTLMVGGVFRGVLGRGQDIMGELPGEAIVFNVDSPESPATLTLASSAFKGACWDGPRGLYIRAGNVQIWVTSES